MSSRPRTEILRVMPGDENGPHRESFLSLLVRTAEANDVSPAVLLERKFNDMELAPAQKIRARVIGHSLGQTINGRGPITGWGKKLNRVCALP